MYGAVLPSYKSSKDKKPDKREGQKQEVIKVDDPRNNTRVRQIMDEYE
jgi:hypothetical protein